MALKLVTPFDKVSQTYLDPIPKIVLMVDGKYVRMPVDGDLIGSFGSFLCRMSEALEGVKVPRKEIDMDRYGPGPQEDEGGFRHAVRTRSGASPS